MITNPLEAFPHFYQNPAIVTMSSSPRWTISDNKKVPLDIRSLQHQLSDQTNKQLRISGAQHINEQSLMTLPELVDFMPSATNNAFYLSAKNEGYYVLDIEPSCPDHIKTELLQLPYLYGEVSMSGKGIHLIMPSPRSLDEFPIALNKKVLREEHGWYEILLDHWITFTRNLIPGHPAVKEGMPLATTSWEMVYASLASTAKETATLNFDIDLEAPEIPYADKIVEYLCEIPYDKEPEHFHNDMSAWEFGYLGYLYNQLKIILLTTVVASSHDHSPSDRAWLLYRAAEKMIPHRDKHDTHRSGMPYLLYIATTLVALRMGANTK